VVFIARVLQVAGHEFHISVSVGISVFPEDGQTEDDLIKRSDSAMYHAKALGRNRYEFFSSELGARAVQRQEIEEALRRALRNHEFVLHYQPKIDIAADSIMGVEALIRWQHPDRGLLKPEEFLAIAEDCRLIIPIGQWVLKEACAQALRWIKAGIRFNHVAVNISASELNDIGFLDNVIEVLRATPLDPSFLELELTETFLLQDVDAALLLLRKINALGVRTAIDDFGTGYSSLSYLHQFPIDTLKIDQSFVRDIASSSSQSAIVKTIIEMGKSLGQIVVAEGVETEDQLSVLHTMQCDGAQGYLFSRPVNAAAFASLLVDGSCARRAKAMLT
jgi:EAL domain-containing protein (putative c-di-GMP-specific phosphodiesterase class I)